MRELKVIESLELTQRKHDLQSRDAEIVHQNSEPVCGNVVNQQSVCSPQRTCDILPEPIFFPVGPLFAIPRGSAGTTAARSTFRTGGLPALCPSAAPIIPCDLPAAFNLRSRQASSRLHGLLLFFGLRLDCCQKLLGDFNMAIAGSVSPQRRFRVRSISSSASARSITARTATSARC
jgi:hypothetical protein